jgi:L-histidine N-alpha-methyltransferase
MIAARSRWEGRPGEREPRRNANTQKIQIPNKFLIPNAEDGAAVFIHRSQYPEAVRAELIRSFKSRAINHKFHYDSYKQAQKWLAVHEAHSPARTDQGCLTMYDTAFDDVATKVGDLRVRVVGLGCGGGQKDARLLQLLRAVGTRVAYVPCDVSLPLVLTARTTTSRLMPASAIEPVVCDLAQAGDLSELLTMLAHRTAKIRNPADGKSAGRERRLVTFFGMIPNFEPDQILPVLASMLRRGDWLLMSANLVPDGSERAMRRILPQYDNERTRDWLMTLLYDVGVEPTDGRLDFTIEQKRGVIPLRRFVARFHFSRRREVGLAETTIEFKRGDVLRLFFSCRYTVDAVTEWLQRGGLEVVQTWVAPSQEEGVFLARH